LLGTTYNVSHFITIFNSLKATGGNQEASLEAIRVALLSNLGADFQKVCNSTIQRKVLKLKKPKKAPSSGPDTRSDEEKNLYTSEWNAKSQRKLINGSIWDKHLNDDVENPQNLCQLQYRDGAKKNFYIDYR